MLLTIGTTHRPATELGYLLAKGARKNKSSNLGVDFLWLLTAMRRHATSLHEHLRTALVTQLAEGSRSRFDLDPCGLLGQWAGSPGIPNMPRSAMPPGDPDTEKLRVTVRAARSTSMIDPPRVSLM